LNNNKEVIYFSKPAFIGNEEKYLKEAMTNQQLSGDGLFTKRCHKWFEKNTGTKKALLTTSCTHALEMAAILLDVKDGDEVIMPSYTFVSTANAFVLRGAKIVFVDIRPDTMNIDETKIEQAITDKTKVIVPVHYAGVACEMDTIMNIAKKHNLFVVEDAAQAITSTYKGKFLGTIGDLGTYSFHDTKNITSGEGGVLLINNEKFEERAEIIREKGTNRSQFFRGEIDKYGWQDLGSSYLPSELNAAILLAQLENIEKIQEKRINIWNRYFEELKSLKSQIELPKIPSSCKHNAHIFYIKCKDIEERSKLIDHLKRNNIYAVFHYVPLHSSLAGKKFGILNGNDKFTTKESERILRLPLHYNISNEDIKKIVTSIKGFYNA
jgi:dTDP-4-amino-4,6-dideoxygalactose transaminase